MFTSEFADVYTRSAFDLFYYRILRAAPKLAATKHPLGWSPIHVAILGGNVGLVEYVLGLPEVDVTAKDVWQLADKDTSEFRIRLLELHGKLGNVETRYAMPLHFSCLSGNWDIIKTIIDTGANFEDQDGKGRTPMEYFDLETVEKDVLRKYQTEYDKWKYAQRKYGPRTSSKISRSTAH